MDHKVWLKTLPPEDATRLVRIDPWAGYLHLAGHAGLICVLGGLIASGVPFWWALLPIHGIAVCFLFTLQHEATHKTPFPNAILNDWVARVIGLIIFQPFEWFRYFHLAHHRHTNDPEHDPELLTGGKPETWAAYLRHVSGVPTFAANISQVWRNAFGALDATYLPKRAYPRIRREARVMLCFYGLALVCNFWSPVLIWIWLVPMLLGQPFLRLYLLAEHGRCPMVANMFENTRTTFTSRAIRFLAWNMPYHTEHHVFPAVPFHNLPDLHRLMQAELRVTSSSYRAFTRDYAKGVK